MVLLSLGAQLIESALVRGVIYTAELGGKVIWWVGSGAFRYIWPPEVEEDEVEVLAERIRVLHERVMLLEDRDGDGTRNKVAPEAEPSQEEK